MPVPEGWFEIRVRASDPYDDFAYKTVKKNSIRFFLGFNDGASDVVAVLFNKDKWSRDEARRWVKKHDLRNQKSLSDNDNMERKEVLLEASVVDAENPKETLNESQRAAICEAADVGDVDEDHVFDVVAVAGETIMFGRGSHPDYGDLWLGRDIEYDGDELTGIEGSAHQLDGKHHDIDHKRDTEHIVGIHIPGTSHYDTEVNGLRSKIYVDPGTEKGGAWYNFVDLKRKFGMTPHISIEALVEERQVDFGDLPGHVREKLNDKYGISDDDQTLNVVFNPTFIGSGAVWQGAGTPEDGVGIFDESNNKSDNMKERENHKIRENGYTPDNPDGYDKSRGAEWDAPTLSDFTDESWGDLSDSGKREIASCFAWARSNPPEKFGDLKLPHHNPDGTVVWNGVTAAMAALAGARGGPDIPSGDKSGVRSHLESHYRDFDEKPPSQSQEGIDNMTDKKDNIDDLVSKVEELENELETTRVQLAEVADERDELSAEKRTSIVNEIQGYDAEYEAADDATIGDLEHDLEVYKRVLDMVDADSEGNDDIVRNAGDTPNRATARGVDDRENENEDDEALPSIAEGREMTDADKAVADKHS